MKNILTVFAFLAALLLLFPQEGNEDTTYPVKNITEIVRKYPETMKDYHHPAWGDRKPGFYWE